MTLAIADGGTGATIASQARQNLGTDLAANVNFTQNGTGAVSRSLQAKGTEARSIFDFIPVNLQADIVAGTSTTDVSSYINQAIADYAEIGGVLYFPKGIYVIGSTLNYVQTSNASCRSGISFVGDGMYSTILQSQVESGPLFLMRGYDAGDAHSGGIFVFGGGFSGFGFDGSIASEENAAHDCIDLSGWQFGVIEDCNIFRFSRNAITHRVNLDYDPNPDFTSSIMTVRDSTVSRIGGFGIYSMLIGAPEWILERVIFAFCGSGGVYCPSGGLDVRACSFGLIGWSAEETLTDANAVSLWLGDPSQGTLNCARISLCEFDSAAHAHIRLSGYQGVQIDDNRFIFRNNQGGSALTPTYGISIGDSDSPVQGVEIKRNFARFDNSGTGSPVLVHFASTASVLNVETDQWEVANALGASFSIADNFNGSNRNIIQNIKIKDQKDNVVSPGRPAPFYLGTITTGTTPAIGTSATVMKYDVADSLCAATFPGDPYYDRSTGVFTAPADGWYDVDASLGVVTSAATDFLRLQIVVNSTTYEAADGGGNGSVSRKTLVNSGRFFLAAGDTLQIKALASPSTTASGSLTSMLKVALEA